MNTKNTSPTVYLVEDDLSLTESTTMLIESWGMKAQTFTSPEAFLETLPTARPGCLLLDHYLGSTHGHSLQEELLKRDETIPIIIVSAYADVSMAIRYFENGALTLIEKPYTSERLKDAVKAAITLDMQRMELVERFRGLSASEESLSERERHVLEMVVAGELNKSIARALGVSQRTVENARARILRKFRANTAAELASKATELDMLSKVLFRADSGHAAQFRRSFANQLNMSSRN